MKKIVIGNQKGGVAKTTLARHLVWAAAERKLRVLVIDFDPQRNISDTWVEIDQETNFSGTWETVQEPDGQGGTYPVVRKVAKAAPGLSVSGLFKKDNRAKPLKCSEFISYIEADPMMVEINHDKRLSSLVEVALKNIAALEDDFDLCVIDTSPAVMNLLVIALSICDSAIAPCVPDSDAVKGLMGFISNVGLTRDQLGLNHRITAGAIVITRYITSWAAQRSIVGQLREAFGALVLDAELYERAVTQTAKNRAVWLTDRGESTSAAAREMRAVCAGIFERVGI